MIKLFIEKWLRHSSGKSHVVFKIGSIIVFAPTHIYACLAASPPTYLSREMKRNDPEKSRITNSIFFSHSGYRGFSIFLGDV